MIWLENWIKKQFSVEQMFNERTDKWIIIFWMEEVKPAVTNTQIYAVYPRRKHFIIILFRFFSKINLWNRGLVRECGKHAWNLFHCWLEFFNFFRTTRSIRQKYVFSIHEVCPKTVYGSKWTRTCFFYSEEEKFILINCLIHLRSEVEIIKH